MRPGWRLHHAHPGAGRHRPLPPRAHGAVLRRVRRAAASPSTSSWPSASAPTDDRRARFNMAVMGLRLAGAANGVAALHGAVSREMFAGLWPDVPTDEVPIGSVTNGVHARTWVDVPAPIDLLTRRDRPTGERLADDWDDRRGATTSCGGRRAGAGADGARPQHGSARPSWSTWCATCLDDDLLDPTSSRSASPAASPPTSGPPPARRSPTGCGP